MPVWVPNRYCDNVTKSFYCLKVASYISSIITVNITRFSLLVRGDGSENVYLFQTITNFSSEEDRIVVNTVGWVLIPAHEHMHNYELWAQFDYMAGGAFYSTISRLTNLQFYNTIRRMIITCTIPMLYIMQV
jgi:hypothetical protein